jgi:uncharacterized damage-inducible protein DinB
MRTRLLLAIPALLVAQRTLAQTAANDATAALRQSFNEVTGYVTRAAEMVPADKYSYRPTASVRTFGQMIGHIADANNYYCAHARGSNMEWSDAVEKGTATKAALVQKLKQSVDACAGAYSASGQPRPLISNIGHTNLHYGNIITYLRMMGMVPPSS